METPLLSRSTVTDPALQPVRCADRWLQTSPEYAMKRLLAAGSGPIYQVSKAFRAGEAGGRHNPEFTLLEWYRPGFDLEALMREVGELVTAVLGEKPVEVVSYRVTLSSIRTAPEKKNWSAAPELILTTPVAGKPGTPGWIC